MAEPKSDESKGGFTGMCVVCGAPLDNHNFRLTEYWRGKSDPYGNICFDEHNPLPPLERPVPNIEPEPDEGASSP